ncbi:hypothetical protein [Methylobacterium sp. J-090]|uniref:hypothetical protein n=1 Tax=Methylobacterium sp. J-090 TaxID=2836666 RepID=UPI001FB99400|nr:hypothetical protein [Methylobacterium sp. J-090]MCJ2083235.1 hypothetical protein [Methylobacterium sp. J-090]
MAGVGRVRAVSAIVLALPLGPVGAESAPSTGPLALPETLRGTVQVPAPDTPRTGMARAPDKSVNAPPIDTLKDLYPALAACWVVPEGLARFERTEITARFALRRDGSVIGTPRVTFATEGGDGRARALLAEAAVSAIRRCTPARVTAALGAAIAGRPIALRFIHHGPRGQGI